MRIFFFSLISHHCSARYERSVPERPDFFLKSTRRVPQILHEEVNSENSPAAPRESGYPSRGQRGTGRSRVSRRRGARSEVQVLLGRELGRGWGGHADAGGECLHEERHRGNRAEADALDSHAMQRANKKKNKKKSLA